MERNDNGRVLSDERLYRQNVVDQGHHTAAHLVYHSLELLDTLARDRVSSLTALPEEMLRLSILLAPSLGHVSIRIWNTGAGWGPWHAYLDGSLIVSGCHFAATSDLVCALLSLNS
jgi:hypothetical protein